MKKIVLKSNFAFSGHYKIITIERTAFTDFLRAIDFRLYKLFYRLGLLNVKRVTEHSNLIMNSNGFGLNLIFRALIGDSTYGLNINIDNASIGSGTTPPTDADTDLQTPVLENIDRSDSSLSGTTGIVTEWFMADGDLPNGTYTEFGLFIGTQLFARSLISPTHTKGSLEDTLIEYDITGVNA